MPDMDLTPRDLPRVFPLVRPLTQSDAASKPAFVLEGGNEPVTRDFLDGLSLLYGVDRGDDYIWVAHRHLTDLGVSADELDERAWQNFLQRCRDKAPQIFSNKKGGLTNLVVIGDGLEGTLFMAGNFWNEIARQLKGRLVAACPARDMLFFCDANSGAALAEMNESIEDVWQKADRRRVSRTVFEWMGDGWLPFEQ